MTDSGAADDQHDVGGLQAERTTLSWTRTSVTVLANGALLTVKGLHGYVGAVDLIPPVMAAVVAVCGYVIALQRQGTLARRPLPKRITPRWQVYLMGLAVLLLIVVATIDIWQQSPGMLLTGGGQN